MERGLVRRVLTVKFEKGLFDHPLRGRDALSDGVSPAGRHRSWRARPPPKSCALLKNENGALPVSKETKKIALVGPFAEDAEELVGPWSSRAHASDIVSLADGIRAKLPAGVHLTVAPGCAIIENGKSRRHLDTSVKIREHPPAPMKSPTPWPLRVRRMR